ncbi:MAG TPA: L-seryl-tRNA(Sec) selenium transferase [Bryobacteraceae bacterium]|nr:L-seryl-tRNA(Sec) selenium transferase [Bryobacteraceae bacterium]
MNQRLRELPSVEEIASRLEGRYPRRLVVSEARRVLTQLRASIRGGQPAGDSPEDLVAAELDRLSRPSLRQVINATGVVLHTNLGRAPLTRFIPIAGYSNLEYNLAEGRRGRRDVHAGGLLERLLERTAIVVNNNAAAVYLALNELAAGYEVLVSRGELIEIGDGFRIPEIMARSGAILREVGTTNRTRLEDYRSAINERTRLLLRVHPSNFQIRGFTEKPELKELAALARERGIPLYEDLGSGCMIDLRRFGITEPLVSESLAAGVNLVSFSGDKLLGGPQAGILAGDAQLVARLRRNPMFRALRVDKLICQALEQTLRAYLFDRADEIPAIRMLAQTPDEIRARAERVRTRAPNLRAELAPGESVAGGGSTPEQALPTWLIAVEGDAVELERRLRAGNPPVVARISDERLVLDLRTVLPEEEDALVAALQALS